MTTLCEHHVCRCYWAEKQAEMGNTVEAIDTHFRSVTCVLKGPELNPVPQVTFEKVTTPEEQWLAERPVGCRCPFGVLLGDCPHHGFLVQE